MIPKHTVTIESQWHRNHPAQRRRLNQAVILLGVAILFTTALFPAWNNYRGANSYAFESVYIPGTNYSIETLRTTTTDYVSSYSFAARDHLIYGVRQNRYVYGYDTINLTNFFERDLGTYTISPLHIYSSALFIAGADGFIHRIDRTTGSVSERIKINDGLVSGIIVANGGTNIILRNSKVGTVKTTRKISGGFSRTAFTVYAGLTITGSDDGTVTIVTNATNIIGTFRASNAVSGSIISTISSNTNFISFIDDGGIVYCITTNGALRWQYTGMSNVIPYPAFYSWANRLIISTTSGDLYSIYITNGAVTFKTNIGVGIATPPTVVRDRIAVGTTNKILAIRDLWNGSLKTNITLSNVIADEIAVCDRGMVMTLSDGSVVLVRNSYEMTLPPDMLLVNTTNAPYVDLVGDTLSWRFNHVDADQRQNAYQYEFSTNTNFFALSYDSSKQTSTNTNITMATGVSDGVYYVRVRTWDTNDRPGLYSSGTNKLYVDRTKPTISAQFITNNVTNTALATNFVSNASISFIVNAYDPTNQTVSSGVSNKSYLTNGTTWYSYTNAVAYALADGVPQTISYIAWDKASNCSVTNKFVMLRDGTAPASTLTANPITFPGQSVTYGYTTTAFSARATDAGAGVNAVYYTIDAAPFIGNTGSSTTNFYLTEGAHTIKYYAVDKLGNTSSTNSFDVTILNPSGEIVRATAMKTPFITASTGYTNIANISENYLIYYNSPVSNGISLETPAPPVMMMAAAATVPAASPYIAAGDFTPLPVTDKSAAKEIAAPVITTPTNIIVATDTNAPAIIISGVSNGSIYAPGIAPLITVSDDSACSSVITLNGMAYTSGTSVTKDGLYILSAYAIDAYSNETTKSISFSIDGTAPDITVLGVTNNGVYHKDVSVSVAISDTNIRRSFATLNGNPLIKSVTLTAEGSYIIHAEADDVAGNTSMKDVRFSIDKTLPIVLISGVEKDKTYTSATINVRVYEDNPDMTRSTLAINSNEYITTLTITADENNVNHYATHIGPITNDGTYALTHLIQDRAGNAVSNRMQFDVRAFYPQSNLSLYAAFDKNTSANIAKGDSNDYSGVRVLVKGGFISNCVAPGITSGDVVVQYRSLSNISADRGTVSFWVKPAWQTPAAKGNYLFTLNNNPNSLDTLAAYVSRTNGLAFSVKNSQQKAHITANGSNWWTNNVWTHLSFTWDFTAQTAAMYVNGVRMGTTSLAGTPRSDMYWLCFAAGEVSGNWQTLKGYMDEARVYNKALSEQEIAALYSFYIPPVTNVSSKNTNAAPVIMQPVSQTIAPAAIPDPNEVVFREGLGKE